MELSTSDTFKTKEDLIQNISDYASSIHFKFNIVETPRTLSFVCKGKQEFNCDACIVTCFKKKENCFSIKRMKLTHKCPIANNDFANTDEYLKNEIFSNINDYYTLNIGDIVGILYNRGIRVNFSSVYYILNGKEIKEQEIGLETYKPTNSKYFIPPNTFSEDKDLLRCFDNKDTFFKFNEINPIIEKFCAELSSFNQGKIDLCYWGKMFFYKVRDYKNILYPLIEIKYYKRNNGIVIYGVLYDPINDPIIYSCVVAEDISDEEALKYFLLNTKDDDFLVEYDTFIIKILEELKYNYFIKTRDVCKFVYAEENYNKEVLEKVWNICNNINNYKSSDDNDNDENNNDENNNGENDNDENNNDENNNGENNKRSDENSIKENNNKRSDDNKINNNNNKHNNNNKINNNNNNKHSNNNKINNNKENYKLNIANFLGVDESKFIKTKSKMKLLNFNNLPDCDVDFVNYNVLSFTFLECINAIVKLSSDNLKLKKRFTKQDPKSLFGYNVTNRIERNEITNPKEDCKVNLEKGTCECGLYQELLIPCVHACKYIKEERLDPYLYVSSIYSKDQYLKLDEIQPVMSIGIKVTSDRFYFKKGPGRPKKSFGKEVEITVE